MTTNNGHGMGAAGAETPVADPLAIPPFLRRQKEDPENVNASQLMVMTIIDGCAERLRNMDESHVDDTNVVETPEQIEPMPPTDDAAPTLEDILAAIRKLRVKERTIAEQIRLLKRQADKMWRAI